MVFLRTTKENRIKKDGNNFFVASVLVEDDLLI